MSEEAIRKGFERLSRQSQRRRENEAMDREYEEKCRAARLLDEVLVLFSLYGEDYNVIDNALKEIARYKKGDPGFPVTASLYEYMSEHGYL